MALVGNNQEALNKFIQAHAAEGSASILSPVPTPQFQWGQTCKQVSGYANQVYLHEQGLNKKPPLPQYDHRFPEGYKGISLQERSQQVIGSKVGEVYGAHDFKKLFDYDGFETRLYRTHDEKRYHALIKALIAQGQPALIFYDCNLEFEDQEKRGVPALNEGRF